MAYDYKEGRSDSKPASLDSGNPIDGVVTDLIETIHRKGRGFTLGVVNDGDKTKVEVVESLEPHDEWEAPSGYRTHKFGDVSSFTSYIQKYGSKDDTVILVDASGASATLIEKLTRGDREKLSLPWVKSQDWKDWTEQLKQPVLHRQLHQFLMRHEHNLDDIGLLQATSKVKAQATVDHNSDIADAGETYGIVFKTAKGEDLIKFPKTIAIRLPVLENDVDESTTVAASIKVEVMMPTNPTEQIRFQLYCSEWDSIFRKRIAQERENIQKQLDGWLVGSGTLAYTDRNLPE